MIVSEDRNRVTIQTTYSTNISLEYVSLFVKILGQLSPTNFPIFNDASGGANHCRVSIDDNAIDACSLESR